MVKRPAGRTPPAAMRRSASSCMERATAGTTFRLEASVPTFMAAFYGKEVRKGKHTKRERKRG